MVAQLHLVLILICIVAALHDSHAFVNQRSIHHVSPQRGHPGVNPAICMSLENFKDDIDVSSSSTSSESSQQQSLSPESTPKSSSSSSSSSFTTQQQQQPQRPYRTKQIERMQGVWWTSEQKDQLVEIRSSYAIFDAFQNTYVSTTSQMPPAVAYPLGGTDDIVTLRTFKLLVPTPIPSDLKNSNDANEIAPQWVPSPTSKVSVQRGGGTAIGTESPSIQTVSPTSTTSFGWERCTNPETSWKSDRVVQGYEESLTTLLASEGPHWSASPVDVLRTIMKGVESDNSDLVDSLCRFSIDSPPKEAVSAGSGVNIGRKNSNRDALLSISEYFDEATGGVSSWSIIKCHYFSSDVCTLRVSISNPSDENKKNSTTSAISSKAFEFCLSRETKKPDRPSNNRKSSGNNKMPASHLFNSIMDVELLVNGKTWAIDHVHTCSC